MFEATLRTYWSDADPAGVVFFPHFFRFLEQAEEEMFRSFGVERHKLLEENHVWFPRVEAFTKFAAPIRVGEAIRVQLKPTILGSKSLRYDFEIRSDANGNKLADGYLTIVCVDAATFKSRAMPDVFLDIFKKLQ